MNTNTNSMSIKGERSTSQLPLVMNLYPFLDPLSACLTAAVAQSVDEANFRPLHLHEQPNAEALKSDPVHRLQAILDRLSAMDTLGPNWDSYNSEAPSANAKEKAFKLIWDIASTQFGIAGLSAIPFAVVPLSGAGVQIEWRGPNRVIEVEVGPDAKASYLVVEGNRLDQAAEERENVSDHDLVRRISTVVG
jgi:hypothetical protein